MDYEKIYDRLCSSRKNRGVEREGGYEIHHILPKSMGGSDDENNLVKLTYREHYIAHKLLYRFTEKEDKVSMAYALKLMSSQKSRITSREYESTNDYLKYTNKIVLRKDEGYVYAKYIKLVETHFTINHEDFDRKLKSSNRRLTALFFICKKLIGEGLKGFVSAHRSSWKRYIVDLENKGFFITFEKEGRKFYKFNLNKFNDPVFDIRCSKNLSVYKLLPKPTLYGIKRALEKYNKENPSRAVIIEDTYKEGLYHILPVTSGWIPTDNSLNSKEDILKFLNNP